MADREPSYPPALLSQANRTLAQVEALHGPLTTGGRDRFIGARISALRSIEHLAALEHIAGKILTPIGWDRIDYGEIHVDALTTMLHAAFQAGAAHGRQQQRDRAAAAPSAGPSPATTMDHSIATPTTMDHSIVAPLATMNHGIGWIPGQTKPAAPYVSAADDMTDALRRAGFIADSGKQTP